MGGCFPWIINEPVNGDGLDAFKQLKSIFNMKKPLILKLWIFVGQNAQKRTCIVLLLFLQDQKMYANSGKRFGRMQCAFLLFRFGKYIIPMDVLFVVIYSFRFAIGFVHSSIRLFAGNQIEI